ncbi:MAG: hypothetical protein SGPRY_003937, partial [Prymnesium sp.]
MSCPGANCPLLQQYTCPPNCPRRELACPIRHCLHWAPVSCKPRKRCARPCTVHEPIESFVNRTLSVVWQDLPEPTPTTRATRKLILITTTFPHSLQLLKLQHCVHVLRNVDNIFWVVSEDAAQPSAGVSQLLRASGISHEHIAYGPTRKGGNAQRNQALKLIRRRKMRGVVYNMDDVRTSPDNAYHPKLWDELRTLRPMRVGVFALRRGTFPPPWCDGYFRPLSKSWNKVGGQKMMIERPLYNATTGSFIRFAAGWCGGSSWLSRRRGRRKYCLDMGAFAFDALLLQQIAGPPWNYSGHGGESEFVDKLIPGGQPEDLQPLGNCGLNVYVFHN